MSRIPVPVSAADAAGNVQQNVSVTVKNRASGSNVTLYAQEVGGSTVSNPLTTDANGRAFAYADRQGLRLDYSAAGFTNYTEYREDAAQPDFVSALPGSPVDGQEVYFQDANMATAGVVWNLRYRAGGGTYKWEFLGGPPLIAEVGFGGAESASSTSYTALTTAGPSIAVPLAGDYIVAIGADVQNNATAWSTYMSYDIGVTGAVDADGIRVRQPTGGGYEVAVSASVERRKNALAASTSLTAKYRVLGGSGTWQRRWMRVTPVRCG